MKKRMASCELCGKEASFVCGKCQHTVYCSKDHQLEHWRTHKDQCMTFKDAQRTKDE